jgi:hypothetical protein
MRAWIYELTALVTISGDTTSRHAIFCAFGPVHLLQLSQVYNPTAQLSQADSISGRTHHAIASSSPARRCSICK